MNSKLQEWLHQVGTALGLIERPTLQPIPIKVDEERRRRQSRQR